jgi:hypothetical protein
MSMMRRVSSRQRLVSWDSFDAVQRELDSNDEESSFEDATSSLGPTLSWNVVDDDGSTSSRARRLVASPPDTVVESDVGFLSGVQPALFKRKRAPRRKTSPKGRAAMTRLFPTLKDDAEAADHGAEIAAVICDDDGGARPCLGSQTDDVVVLLSSYLDLGGVRNLAQANRRLRDLLHGEEYVWNVQAERLWTSLPMARQEISWESGAEERPALSKLETLALAQHSVPTEVDASIFTPCRWSRTLRSRTVAVRSSLQKELAVVPTDDPARPAVQFLGTPGHGDRSVRANAPLPRPTQLLPRQRGCWRTAFFRRGAEASLLSSSPSSTGETSVVGGSPPNSDPSTAPTRSKWQPFVVPTLLQRELGGSLAWDLSPRLVSYFEVEILPPAPSAAVPYALGTTGGGRAGLRRLALSAHGRVRFRLDDTDEDEDSDEEPAANMQWLRHSKECVAVGLATEEFSMHTRMPGWDAHSWYVPS